MRRYGIVENGDSISVEEVGSEFVGDSLISENKQQAAARFYTQIISDMVFELKIMNLALDKAYRVLAVARVIKWSKWLDCLEKMR